MAWSNEQAQFCRGLVSHYCTQLGIGTNELAETTGISKHRLASLQNNTGELSSAELDSLFEVMGELARAEKLDMDEGQQPARSYQDVINEVIFATGGESK
jgi:hypothetical protein